MKIKKGIMCILCIACFTFVFANEQNSNTSKKTQYQKSQEKLYNKYINPLKIASREFHTGTVSFKMSFFTAGEENPRVYDCTLAFSRWPAIASALPSIVFNIGDSVLYVSNNDSLYTFNLIAGTYVVDSFQTALEFLWSDPFLAFYSFWFEFLGKIENISAVKEKDLTSVKFEKTELSPYDRVKLSIGYHQFTYMNKGGNLLKKYSYEPTGEWKEKTGFQKIEYELTDYQRGVYPSEVLMRWGCLIK